MLLRRLISHEPASVFRFVAHDLFLMGVHNSSIDHGAITRFPDDLLEVVFALRGMLGCEVLRQVTLDWEDSVVGHLVVVVAILLLG